MFVVLFSQNYFRNFLLGRKKSQNAHTNNSDWLKTKVKKNNLEIKD